MGLSGRKIASRLKRGHEAIYRVIRQLKEGLTAIDVYLQCQANKAKCGRKKIQLSPSRKDYINEKVRDGWTPDVIIGCNERSISCSMRTLYRKFESDEFNQKDLPMKGKRKPNGYKEKRGKQSFIRSIRTETMTIRITRKNLVTWKETPLLSRHHKSAVITLVERLTKCIIAIKPEGRRPADVESSLNQWLDRLPQHLFKSIIFDCDKEFSNWKSISNKQDIDIYFADPGTPSQRGLNEHSNGLLRKNGLPKEIRNGFQSPNVYF